MPWEVIWRECCTCQEKLPIQLAVHSSQEHEPAGQTASVAQEISCIPWKLKYVACSWSLPLHTHTHTHTHNHTPFLYHSNLGHAYDIVKEIIQDNKVHHFLI